MQLDDEDGAEGGASANGASGHPGGTSPDEARAEQPAGVAAGSETLSVVCPVGVGAGDSITITTQEGEELEVVCPEGVRPGDDFHVEVERQPDGTPRGRTTSGRAPTPHEAQLLSEADALQAEIDELDRALLMTDVTDT